MPLAVEHAHCENRFQLVNIAASRRRPAVAAKRIEVLRASEASATEEVSTEETGEEASEAGTEENA